MLRGVVFVLLRYKVRVLSYASGAFPCIVRVRVLVLHVALLRVLLGDWAVGLVTKAHFPIVRSMGARRVPHRHQLNIFGRREGTRTVEQSSPALALKELRQQE